MSLIPLPGPSPIGEPLHVPFRNFMLTPPIGPNFNSRDIVMGPVASVPKPSIPSNENAKSEVTTATTEERLATLESEVAALKVQLDDAGILRAHPAKDAAPALRQE